MIKKMFSMNSILADGTTWWWSQCLCLFSYIWALMKVIQLYSPMVEHFMLYGPYLNDLCCIHMDLTLQSICSHLLNFRSSLHFVSPSNGCLVTSVALMSLVLPSLFLFVDKECKHNFMCTFYFYLLATFNHYLPNLNQWEPDGAFNYLLWVSSTNF